jgi:short-subunit dehydrogenase involved in D-alanine esterification of teichoic acids
LTHEFLPFLKRRTTSAVINVSSVLALVPKQSASVYCATKAAIHSFSRSLRWQLEGTKVKVFEIVPPLVDTAMTTGRGKGKLSPEALSAEFWSGFKADKLEMHIGKAKAAALIARLLPSIAERIIRYG